MNKYLFFILLLCTITFGCNNGPKVVSATKANDSKIVGNSGIFSENSSSFKSEGASPFEEGSPSSTGMADLHSVQVQEVLPTSKYVYLKVLEKGEEFWIACRKQEVKKGATYFYKGGLLKTNFESKEYSRIFDRIYLVSNLISAEQHAGVSNQKGEIAMHSELPTSMQEQFPGLISDPPLSNNIDKKASVKIADLVKNPKKYEGKRIQISGKCVKINPNIMNRNWIHIQDGSKDDFDLVITTDAFIPEGQFVTLSAVVGLDRDFGAGYKYDLILENGTLLSQQ